MSGNQLGSWTSCGGVKVSIWVGRNHSCRADLDRVCRYFELFRRACKVGFRGAFLGHFCHCFFVPTRLSARPVFCLLGSLKISLSFLASQHFHNRYMFRVLTMADHFPNGVTLNKMEGTLISVESQHFRLTRLISEKFITGLQAYSCDGVAAVLKLRFQCVFRSSYLMSFTKIIFKGWIHLSEHSLQRYLSKFVHLDFSPSVRSHGHI
jgi:hypothetical protein